MSSRSKRARQFRPEPRPTPAGELFVAIPTYGAVEWQTASSLIRLADHARRRGQPIGFLFQPGHSLVHVARNLLVHAFLESAASHLLFVDVDEEFQPETVLRMLDFERRHHVGVVAAPVPYKLETSDGSPVAFVGEPLLVDGQARVCDGFCLADSAGTGLMLIARAVFEKMGAQLPLVRMRLGAVYRPYFEPSIVEAPDGTWTPLGEDQEFLRRWLKLGGEIWIDLEARVGHIGKKTYGCGRNLAEHLGIDGELVAQKAAGE